VNCKIPGSPGLSVFCELESGCDSYKTGGGGLRLEFSKASSSSSRLEDTVVTLEMMLCLRLAINSIETVFN
jgi:hypothetical protein